jgi:predicted ester cyclase
MSEAQNIATIRRAYEAFSTGDLDALDDLIVADVVDHSPAPDQGPGLPGVKAMLAEFRAAVPDVRFTVEDMMAAGDRVVTRATVSGTDEGGLLPGRPPTGRSFAVQLIDIVRFADGKAVERWGIMDDLAMMAQLGAIPELAPAGG